MINFLILASCLHVQTASDQQNAEGYLSLNVTYADGHYKKLNSEMRAIDYSQKICSNKELTGVWVQNDRNDSWVGTFSAYNGLFRCVENCHCSGGSCLSIEPSNLLSVGTGIASRSQQGWSGTICSGSDRCYLRFEKYGL